MAERYPNAGDRTVAIAKAAQQLVRDRLLLEEDAKLFIPSVNQDSVAPDNIDGLLLAATPGNRDGFRRTARHIGSIGRGDRRRISMGPIPGNVMGIGVMNIARCRWRHVCHGFATRGPIEGVPDDRPEGIVSAMLPERVGEQRTGNLMRRGKR
jgi:hypothetical protein